MVMQDAVYTASSDNALVYRHNKPAKISEKTLPSLFIEDRVFLLESQAYKLFLAALK